MFNKHRVACSFVLFFINTGLVRVTTDYQITKPVPKMHHFFQNLTKQVVFLMQMVYVVDFFLRILTENYVFNQDVNAILLFSFFAGQQTCCPAKKENN